MPPRPRGKDPEASRHCVPKRASADTPPGRRCVVLRSDLLDSPPARTEASASLASHSGPGPTPLPAPHPQSRLLLASKPAHAPPPGTPSWPTSQPPWAPGHAQSCSLAWETPELHTPPLLPSANTTTVPGPDVISPSAPALSTLQTQSTTTLCSLRMECPSCFPVANSYASFKTPFKWHELLVPRWYNL